MYIGWGTKYSADPYSPPQPPNPEPEFVLSADITEAADPTREEEIAYEAAQKAKQGGDGEEGCLLYTSPSPRDGLLSRMPSSA